MQHAREGDVVGVDGRTRDLADAVHLAHASADDGKLGLNEVLKLIRRNGAFLLLRSKVFRAQLNFFRRDHETTRLRNYEITKLRDYEITRLRDYEITRLRNTKLRNYEITKYEIRNYDTLARCAIPLPGPGLNFGYMHAPIKSHRQLEVHKTALAAALALSKLAGRFPADERGLREQVRRCGRSPGAAIAESWRKRHYPDFWRNKLTDAQSESGESQWWLDVALAEGYCTRAEFEQADNLFEKLIAQLSKMVGNPQHWIVKRSP
ncbi:MAG TPA: four helix bundle protein [Longimicrobiales bacterium]